MPDAAVHTHELSNEQARALSRAETMARVCIHQHNLDLRGLTVYTEAATGWYGFIPCIAAMAGAQVIAVAAGSAHGTAHDAMTHVATVAAAWQVSGIRTVDRKTPADLALADIVTNNGHVRPLNRELVAALKPTAVIPLMWESFEWREDELDLAACRERDILALGTDEGQLDFFAFAAESMEKMLHTRSIPMHGSTILALGSGPFMGIIARELRHRGAVVRCAACSPEKNPIPGETLLTPHSAELHDWLRLCDVILCDERYTRDTVIGPDGVLTVEEIETHRPDCVVLNHHGTLDGPALVAAGIDCCPHERTAAWMIPTFTTNILGPRPVIRLMTAGLKVGESMARARLAGASVHEAARRALAESPAQDFPPPWNWLSENNSCAYL